MLQSCARNKQTNRIPQNVASIFHTDSKEEKTLTLCNFIKITHPHSSYYFTFGGGVFRSNYCPSIASWVLQVTKTSPFAQLDLGFPASLCLHVLSGSISLDGNNQWPATFRSLQRCWVLMGYSRAFTVVPETQRSRPAFHLIKYQCFPSELKFTFSETCALIQSCLWAPCAVHPT